MCWMIKQEAPEHKNPKSNFAPTRNRRHPKGKGHALGPPGARGVHGPLTSVVGERCSAVGPTNAAAVANFMANMGRPGAGGCVRYGPALHTGQGLRPCSVPSRTRHQRGRASRTYPRSTRANRSESSSRSSSQRYTGKGTTVVSARTGQLSRVDFVAASRPDSPILPLSRREDWRQSFASDSALRPRALCRHDGNSGQFGLLYFWRVVFLGRDRGGQGALVRGTGLGVRC